MLFEEYAKKFQILHKKESGEDLSLEEAFENWEKITAMVRIAYKPIPKNDFRKLDSS